jgi:hypothetical protein
MTDQKQKPAPLQEWQQDAIRTVPDSLVRDLVSDFRRGPPVRSSLASRPGSPQEPARPAGGGTVPITAVPGVSHMDAIAESFARRDRAVRVQQEMELAEVERRLERKNPHKAATEYNPYSRERMGFSDDD